MKIEKDEIGLYTNAGNWKARPVIKTQFKEGDDVATYHFGGTILAGVGKDENCKRGQYIERWTTCGTYYGGWGETDQEKDEYGSMVWYQVEALWDYSDKYFKGIKPTKNQIKKHDNYLDTTEIRKAKKEWNKK